MKYEFYEAADMADPLEILLAREAEEQGSEDFSEVDRLESQYRAALHRTAMRRTSDNTEYIEPSYTDAMTHLH